MLSFLLHACQCRMRNGVPEPLIQAAESSRYAIAPFRVGGGMPPTCETNPPVAVPAPRLPTECETGQAEPLIWWGVSPALHASCPTWSPDSLGDCCPLDAKRGVEPLI